MAQSQKDYKNLIKGDWRTNIFPEYVKSKTKRIDTIYTYYEYALTNEYIYTFSDAGDYILPQKYEIKKDSMFFYCAGNCQKKIGVQKYFGHRTR